MSDIKLEAALEAVGEAAGRAVLDNPGAAISALKDAERALKRIINRAATLPEQFERVELNQPRGPKVEFTGRLLCETEFETRGRDPMRMAYEVWETRRGDFVAVTSFAPIGRDGFEDVRVLHVERQDDEQAMRFAVMDWFEWNDRARSMVRKLGWDLRLDLDGE